MSILTIKQIVKGSGADKFGLWSGTTQLKAQVIGAKHLLDTLNDGRANTAKFLKTTDSNAEKALAEAENSMIIECEDTKIVSEFKLIKRADSVELDLDGFFIHDDYMVNDDKAPDRILSIVTELRECVNQMFAMKNEDLEANADACRENVLTTGRAESGEIILVKVCKGKHVPVMTDTIPFKDVVNTLHFYQCRYGQLVAQEYAKPIVTSKGKKYLPDLILSCEDGCVKVGNISKFNVEVQQVVNDMIGYFRLTK